MDEIESSLAIQEFLQQLVRENPADVASLVNLPESVDEKLWQYEHLRQFCLELNDLAVALEHECTANSCPQMKATDEWLYLCAAHKAPQEVGDVSILIAYVEV